MSTQTFRQRLPPYGGGIGRRRAEDPIWTDKVFKQDITQGDKGFAAGGGLTIYKSGDSTQYVPTRKVQAVPTTSKDASELPPDLSLLRDPKQYDDARAALRPYALKVFDDLNQRPGKSAAVRDITRTAFPGARSAMLKQMPSELQPG